MSWNYSGDPRTSDKDAVRVLIQDTNPEEPLMDDEEILFFLELEGDLYSAAAGAAQALAARFSSEVESVTIGDYSEKRAQANRYLTLAETLRKARQLILATTATPFAGGIRRSQKAEEQKDQNRVKPIFHRHMHEGKSRVDRG